MTFAKMWTPFITVITEVLVIVIGQIFLESVIKPLQEYKRIKAKVSYLLAFYANVYTNPIVRGNGSSLWDKESAEKVSTEFRNVACELVGFKQQKNKLVRKKRIEKASSNLIGLSNGLYTDAKYIDARKDENEKRVYEIKKALRLK